MHKLFQKTEEEGRLPAQAARPVVTDADRAAAEWRDPQREEARLPGLQGAGQRPPAHVPSRVTSAVTGSLRGLTKNTEDTLVPVCDLPAQASPEPSWDLAALTAWLPRACLPAGAPGQQLSAEG